MRRTPGPAWTLALAAIAAGCAGTRAPAEPGGGPAEPDPRFSAEDHLSAGDYDRASLEFEKLAAAAPGDAALAEKVRTAKRLAAQSHAVAAAAAAERRDFARAAYELRRAEAFDRDAEPVRRVREALGPKVEAAQSLERSKGLARELLLTDPQAAAAELTELRRQAPYDPDLVEMLTEATRRTEADRAADRAAEAWDAGVRRRAVEHLAAADFAGAPTARAAAVRRRMENDLVAESGTAELPALRDAYDLATAAKLSAGAVDTLRDRLGTALLREVRTHEAAGRHALAALFEVEAQRISSRVDPRNLDRVRGEQGVRIHVLPFEDATEGSADGPRIARALRDRLAIDAAGGGAAVFATDEPPPPGARWYPHLVLSGTVTSRRVTSGRAGRETQRVRYVAGARDATNPRAARLNDELTAARTRMTRTADAVASAEAQLRSLRALGFGRGPGGQPGTEGDVAYQVRLASAEATLETARRADDAARRDEFDVRQRILSTSATVSEPVWAETPVEVTTMVRTAELVARLRLAGGPETFLDQVVTGSDVHRETVSPGFPQGGVPADPDDSPDDAAMAVRAAAAFAENAAGAVRAAAEGAARRLLLDGREAERRGDPLAAAEAFATYLLVTTDTPTPERADAARAIHEITRTAPVLRTGFRPETAR